MVALSCFVASCGSGDDSQVGGAGDSTQSDADVASSDAGHVPPDSGQTDTNQPDTAQLDGQGADSADSDADPDSGLASCPPGKACDDGDPCTKLDVCDADGSCGGTPYQCDDGRPCTDDLCDGTGNCHFQVAAGACLIANVCYAWGDESPSNACAVCDEAAVFAWTVATPRSCDDGNACTFGDSCADGACVGKLVECDDGEPCTADVCDPAIGCLFTPTLAVCDDGDACTLDDYCSAEGDCVGAASLLCEDDNPCTANLCDDLAGCVFAPIGGPCSDGDVCTVADSCDEGVCVAGPQNACSDGNSCTDDTCDSVSGCMHTANDNPCCVQGVNPCDDGNPCTSDLCGGDGSDCQYEPFGGSCTDGDACTPVDTCIAGECVGSGVLCDDGNPCTADSCENGVCSFAPLSDQPCDDGVECTASDTCVAGACVGLDDTACQCVPSFDKWVSRVTALAIGENGQSGQGLNIDGNSATCSPASNCAAGVDNALSVVSSFANDALAGALADGDLNLLFEHAGYASGQTYDLQVYIGDPVGNCAAGAAGCSFQVAPESLDDDCQPLVVIGDASISGGVLTAGGPGSQLTLPLPIAGLALEVTLHHVRLQAQVTAPGSPSAQLVGVLGGAIVVAELKAAIQALPDDTFAPPLDKATVLGFIDFLVTADIDTDGNGQPDAASIGLPFSAKGASITGLQ